MFHITEFLPNVWCSLAICLYLEMEARKVIWKLCRCAVGGGEVGASWSFFGEYLHVSVFRPSSLGLVEFSRGDSSLFWLDRTILVSSVPCIKRKEKAEMSSILGHKLLLNPLVFCRSSLPPSTVPCVTESRDPVLLFYSLTLGWWHRVEEEIWRCFLNRLPNNLSVFSSTIICSSFPSSTAIWCQFLNLWASAG